MVKYLLEFDPKNEPNRLKFYSSKYPNGIYFTEEKTKSIFEMIFKEESVDEHKKGNTVTINFDDYTLRIKNYNALSKLRERQKPNKAKSVAGKKELIALSIFTLATILSFKYGMGTTIKTDSDPIIPDDPKDGYEETSELQKDNLDLIYDNDQTLAATEKSKVDEPVSDYTPQAANKIYEINYNITPRTAEYFSYKEQARERYGKLIEEAAAINGLDPELLLDMCTAESLGLHSTTSNSTGDVGLFQINKGVWLNYTMRYYNYVTNQYETLTFTEENINNADMQPMLGALVYRDCLNNMDNNMLAALLGYNWGWPQAKNRIGDRLYDKTDHSYEDSFKINSTYDNYMEAVLSYHPAGKPIEIKTAPDANGKYETLEFHINNALQKNTDKTLG